MSIEAVRLLQLKAVARTQPTRPADQIVPALWIAMLVAARKLRRRPKLTVGQFYREMAELDGFTGRKSDGDPGWITIWRGGEKLYLMVRGSELVAELGRESQKCG